MEARKTTANQNQLTGNFIVLSCDETHIVLPLEDVGQANYLAHDITWHANNEHSGLFYSDNYPDKSFIALSDNLKPMTSGLDDRFIMLPFADTDDGLLWCWKTAKLINDHTFDIHVLPDFMVQPNSPINSFTCFEGKIIFPCRVKHLLTYALAGVA